jgi:hypothetical protein
MTPQQRLVVLIDLITIKVIEFQNFAGFGADRSDLLKFVAGIGINWVELNIPNGTTIKLRSHQKWLFEIAEGKILITSSEAQVEGL